MAERRAGEIPGYGYGVPDTARSPLSVGDLDLLKETVLFTEEDEHYLRMACASWLLPTASSRTTPLLPSRGRFS